MPRFERLGRLFRVRRANRFVRSIRRLLRHVGAPSRASPTPGAVVSACVDVNEVIASAAAALAPLVGERIHVDVRPSAERAIVRGDVRDIEYVLMALALHARHEMPEGGSLTVESAIVGDLAGASDDRGTRRGNRVRVTVIDTGRGVPRAVPGGGDASVTVDDANLAPGLVVAGSTVRRLGGTLHVTREPFVGTTVTVEWPLA